MSHTFVESLLFRWILLSFIESDDKAVLNFLTLQYFSIFYTSEGSSIAVANLNFEFNNALGFMLISLFFHLFIY